MPRIAPIDTAHAAADVQATLSAVKAKIGMVPNLFTTFAQSPAVLNGYLGFSDALTHGALTGKQREIISLAVAQANGCHYCLSAHTLMGKGAGLSPKASPRPAVEMRRTLKTTRLRHSPAAWSRRRVR